MGYERRNGFEWWVGDLPENIKRRFLTKVNKTDDCWLWEGRVNPGGMGQFRIAPKSKGNQTGCRLDVHKLIYLWFKGPIHNGMEIDHLCRVPTCVNPDHLDPVTHLENMHRGVAAVGTHHSRKTHCIHGHPFNDENTYWWRGKRVCRACVAINKQNLRLRRTGA